MEIYINENSFLTAQYPTGWVAQSNILGDMVPFPHVGFGSHREIMDLSLAEKPLPEDQIGAALMLVPHDMFAEAGVTAETPLEEVAKVVLTGMFEGVEGVMEKATFASITLNDSTPAVYITAASPNEDYVMNFAELSDGLYLLASQILAVGYRNAELEAQTEAIVNSVEFTTSSNEVMAFIMEKISAMEASE